MHRRAADATVRSGNVEQLGVLGRSARGMGWERVGPDGKVGQEALNLGSVEGDGHESEPALAAWAGEHVEAEGVQHQRRPGSISMAPRRSRAGSRAVLRMRGEHAGVEGRVGGRPRHQRRESAEQDLRAHGHVAGPRRSESPRAADRQRLITYGRFAIELGGLAGWFRRFLMRQYLARYRRSAARLLRAGPRALPRDANRASASDQPSA